MAFTIPFSETLELIEISFLSDWFAILINTFQS
jgi:hypothetical protein